MKLLVLAVGKLKDRALVELCGDFAGRIAHYTPVEVVEAKDDAALQRAIPGRAIVVALDSRGTTMTSEAFAGWIADQQLRGGAGALCFLIGGADGLPDAVKQRAARVLSFGPMTLPHKLARLILLEQLYRAFTIIKGEPYHH